MALQYKGGKSIARLVSSKDLPDTLSLQDLVARNAKALEKLTENYQSLSSRTIVFHEQKAIEEVCTYTIEGFAAFQEKSISLLRDNTYYRVLCQCIKECHST